MKKESYVLADKKLKTYEVVLKGKTIAKDYSTFAPGHKEGSYLAYSITGGVMTYPAPGGWEQGMRLKAVTLTKDGDGVSVKCCISEGKIILEMPSDVPVRVIREITESVL